MSDEIYSDIIMALTKCICLERQSYKNEFLFSTKAQLGFSMPLFLPRFCFVFNYNSITVGLSSRPSYSWARYNLYFYETTCCFALLRICGLLFTLNKEIEIYTIFIFYYKEFLNSRTRRKIFLGKVQQCRTFWHNSLKYAAS